MDFPRAVSDIVEDAARKHSEDLNAATAEAERRIRKLPEYPQLVDQLLTAAVYKLVCDARHRNCTKIKYASGRYFQDAKVRPAGEGVIRAYRSWYDYCIAGRTLGEIKGGEWAAIAEEQKGKRKGFQFNEELALWFDNQRIPEGVKTRDAVPLKKIQQAVVRIKKRIYGGKEEALAGC